MADSASVSFEPFLRIFVEPRATIRAIVDSDPTRHVILLAALAPALAALESAWSSALGGKTVPGALWPIAVVVLVALSAVGGIAAVYANGWILRWIGALLGGTATTAEVRAALAWSGIPGMVGAALSIAAVVAGLAVPPAISTGHFPQLTGSLMMFGLLNGVLGIWGFVVALKCIGEVHRFSAWRALSAVVIEGLAVIAAVVAIAVLPVMFLSHWTPA
jgi:Yip1 domain